MTQEQRSTCAACRQLCLESVCLNAANFARFGCWHKGMSCVSHFEVQLNQPEMLQHFQQGQRDILIPCSHGRSLFDLCPSRKVFINPEFMEHNTNLTVDHGFLILPMFRFFALPDYSFQELHVPTWAFDKRRSPLYKKPDVQVCSRQKMGQSALDGASGSVLSMS